MNLIQSIQKNHARCLVDDNLSLHSSSLMWLAVVVVLSSNIELSGDSLSWGIEVVLVGESISIHSSWNSILVEDNVVWESSVVGPGDGVSLGDGDGGWLEDESSCRHNDNSRISLTRTKSRIRLAPRPPDVVPTTASTRRISIGRQNTIKYTIETNRIGPPKRSRLHSRLAKQMTNDDEFQLDTYHCQLRA